MSELPAIYEHAILERKAKGHIIVEGYEVASTLQCCHCGNHFLSIRGSGITRGFCMKCSDITCGCEECDPCIPFEKKLDEYEKAMARKIEY